MALFMVIISTALFLVARAQYDDDSTYSKQPSYQPTYQPSPKPYSPPADYQRPSPYVPQPVYPNPSNPPSYPSNPVYPQKPVYPNPQTTPSYPSNPVYPQQPVYPSPPNQPSYPSNPVYPQQPEYPSPPNQPSYPSNPVYPQQPEYPSPPNQPSYPSNPVYPQKPDYPNTPDKPYQDGPSYSDDDYSNQPHSVRPAPGTYPCKRNSDVTKYAVPYVCFAYFECVYGEALYRQCDKYYRFDEKSGRCVSDQSCVIACPDHIKPHPTDSHKFYLGDKEKSCSYRTYFNYRICTCQSPENESVQYPPYRK